MAEREEPDGGGRGMPPPAPVAEEVLLPSQAPTGDLTGHAMRGTLWLVVRQGFISVLTLIGVLALSLLLGPADFSLYGYASTLILLTAAVGDLGLGASLIRGEPTDRHLRGSFALQLAVLGPAIAILAAAAAIGGPYGFTPATALLLLGAAFLLCLQTLPTALLERRMSFKAIAALEVVQRGVFIGLAVTIAAINPAQWAIPLALAASAIVGYPAALILSDWKWLPRFARGEPIFRGFSSDWWQARIANQLTYAAYPLLGGILFSRREVGLMVWALAISSVPALLAPSVSRAVLPVLSRVDPRERIRLYSLMFRGLLMVAFPMCAALLACAAPLTTEIFGHRWVDGIPLLRLESVTTILGVAMMPATPLLFLTFRSKRVKLMMVGWLVAVLAIGTALAPVVSFKSISIAQIIAGAVVLVITDRALRRHDSYSPIRDMLPGFAGAAVAIGICLPLASSISGIPATIGLLALCALIQLGVMLALRGGVDPRTMLATFRQDSQAAASAPARAET